MRMLPPIVLFQFHGNIPLTSCTSFKYFDDNDDDEEEEEDD